jgi:uncharacterized protein (TIGR02246 family)
VRKAAYATALLALLVLVWIASKADEPRGETNDPEVLKARAGEFTKAFDRGDAKALADFWTADGDYVNVAGHTLKGRKEIQAAFEKQFAAAKGAKLHIKTTSLRVLKDGLAIEDGTTEVTYPGDAAPTAARYTAVHVKQGGQWYLASVRDAAYVPPSNHEQLSELDWLAGAWVAEAGKGEVAKATYFWAENGNFLVSSFATTIKDVPLAGGTQWIGWDAAAKHIRSWSFNSNGGFSEATWSRDGNKWTVKVTATTRDGKKVTATVAIAKVDDDHHTWQSTGRSVEGKALPDSDVIKMKRAN